MLKYSHISRPRSCRVGDVNHQPACWNSELCLSESQWGLVECPYEIREWDGFHKHTHQHKTPKSPKVNKAMAFQKPLSFHLHESLLSNPSLHILSSVWQRGGERKNERERERDDETFGWLASCLDRYRRMWRALSSLISPLFSPPSLFPHRPLSISPV